ncbi:hypothetical protein ACHAWU_002392 [Discostella pseudostelligera]|uniref:Alpha/beta hydrolase fold-3 domain-containing protein n=1 Tax=Discostella pseudostelligera TaxID=259834 RepID=A0ABD3MC25_9STRA
MKPEDAQNNDGQVDHIKNWKDHVHPELKPLMRWILDFSVNSWWKAHLLHVLLRLPVPVSAGVQVRKIKGIGAYFYPAGADDDDDDDEQSSKNNSPSSAILWIHGGGRIVGSPSGGGTAASCSKLVTKFGIPVLSAEYRLAPNHAHPAALDDIISAYHWLAKKCRGGKIAVGGESAGGGLAAELCQRLLDEQSEMNVPLPVCQLLIYPMLDDRTCENESHSKVPPHLVWNNTSNHYAWSCYLGPDYKPGDENLPKYASASRREDLSGLPPAWIHVGDLDLFHEECIEYSRRLKYHGVETELVLTKGGFHGMMSMGTNEQPVLEVWDSLHGFGKEYLSD